MLVPVTWPKRHTAKNVQRSDDAQLVLSKQIVSFKWNLFQNEKEMREKTARDITVYRDYFYVQAYWLAQGSSLDSGSQCHLVAGQRREGTNMKSLLHG